MPSWRVLLVRHAEADISPNAPAGDWPLTEAGSTHAQELGRRLALQLGDEITTVVASTERKAIETASGVSASATLVDRRLREVTKPWYSYPGDHHRNVLRYLQGTSIPEWEPQDEAIERFGAAVAAQQDNLAAVVSHGTVMSLWLSATIADFNPVPFWLDLRFPDAYLLDLDAEPLLQRI